MPTVLKRVEKSCHLPTPGRAEAGGGRTSLWFARSRRRLLLGSDDTAAGEVAKGRRNKAAAVRAGGGTAEVGKRKAVGGGVTDIKGELFSLFSSGVAENVVCHGVPLNRAPNPLTIHILFIQRMNSTVNLTRSQPSDRAQNCYIA
jgi:hypothetical protein